jgi:hypothetical protein
MNVDKAHYFFERRRITPEEIYKGDGISTCKWCGDTGWMHTFLLDGTLLSDAPCCACKLGRKILHEQIMKDKESEDQDE